jgi:hypothetical protein
LEPEIWNNWEDYAPKAHVILSCNRAYHDADDVEFLDISEDIQGRDIMTFTCPVCGETHSSFVLG